MAYDALLAVACLILATRFAFETRASSRSRALVVAAALASFYSPWYVARILVQLADSLYVLLYYKARVAPPS